MLTYCVFSYSDINCGQIDKQLTIIISIFETDYNSDFKVLLLLCTNGTVGYCKLNQVILSGNYE